jgi:hypothetical protein
MVCRTGMVFNASYTAVSSPLSTCGGMKWTIRSSRAGKLRDGPARS